MAQNTHQGSTTRETKGSTGQFEQFADKAADKMKSAAESAEGMANRVMDHGREAGEGVQEVAGNLKNAVDRSVKDQPMATLAMVAAVGFVLGAIWKS
jgi:ElaB/YqjD/DUF883 family membrane-anchored ribosome-binding protein